MGYRKGDRNMGYVVGIEDGDISYSIYRFGTGYRDR